MRFDCDGKITQTDNAMYESKLSGMSDISAFDLDGDGVLGEFDKTVVKLTTLEIGFNQMIDVNNDGNTNLKDLMRIKRLIADEAVEGDADRNKDNNPDAADIGFVRKFLVCIDPKLYS